MKTITKLQQAKAPAEKKKLRVAAYCRVSTGSEAQLESLDTQKTYFENYINSRNDWELAGIYYDDSDKIGLNQQSPYSKGGALI